jgi:hypothetical protein
MESSTEVGEERRPLAPWSVRFGCFRREPRRTGQLGGAYRSSVGLQRMTSWQRQLVTGYSGSRPAALETALRGQEPPTSRSGVRWLKCESGLGRCKKILDGEISAAGPERLSLVHTREQGAGAGWCVCARMRVCDITATSWEWQKGEAHAINSVARSQRSIEKRLWQQGNKGTNFCERQLVPVLAQLAER